MNITHTLEPDVLAVGVAPAPGEPMPPLAKLVVASAFDAAEHKGGQSPVAAFADDHRDDRHQHG